MKTNFRKILAVLLAVMMVSSVFSVVALAADPYTITYKPGADGVGDEKVVDTTANRQRLEDALYTRPGYVQAGWSTKENSDSKDFNLKAYYTKKVSVVLYPYWEGVDYTVTFHPDSYTTSGTTTTRTAKYNSTVALPEAIFTRDGYTQTGWSLTEGGEKAYDVGAMSGVITGDLDLYPYWSKMLSVSYAPGAYGTGAESSSTVPTGSGVTLKGAVYTRTGYTQIGWSTVDGGEKEYELYAQNIFFTDDVVLYPAWLKNVYKLDVSVNRLNFGDTCINYTAPEAMSFEITNNGNVPATIDAIVSDSYQTTFTTPVTLVVGASLTVYVQPKAGLGLADYASDFVINVADDTSANKTVALAFSVSDHIYDEYVSAGDATYTADGTLEALCIKGCGHKDVIADPGSMKVYSADNNDAVGLNSSYIHHRTVRFTAYGSGMDDKEGVVGKRFRPVSWYVNDEFNGEFEDGYDVTFTHTIFGEYTLTINYVEEEYDDATKEWVATGETDTKTFDYTVGTTAEEEQEIVRPNTILNIIFGLFAKLLSLLGIGG